MLNKALLVFLLSFSITTLVAQKKEKDVEVIEFGDDGNEASESSKTGFIIKTNPVSYLFGWQFLEIERPITDFFSAQAGIGLTFSSIGSELYSEVLNEYNSETYGCESEVYIDDHCDDIFDTEIRNQKIGIVFSSSARLFFDDDAPDGAFFGLNFRYLTKSFDVEDIIQGASNLIRTPEKFQKESERHIDVIGQYGYQFLYTNLTTEYFVGLGARFSKLKKQDIGQINGLYVSSIEPFKRVNYRFDLGVRIGFQL